MIFDENPFTSKTNDIWKEKIYNSFPILNSELDKNPLPFKEYLNDSPQSLYIRDVFEYYYHFLEDFFNSDSKVFKIFYDKQENELNSAFKYLDELNRKDVHDKILPNDSIDLMRYVDNQIHFPYLKVIEGVYFAFIFPIAFQKRKNRKSSSDGLNLFNCVQELDNEILKSCYDNTVRNGIAHGNVTFQERVIVYRGNRGNPVERDPLSIIRTFNSSVDVCNSISLAWRTFFYNYSDKLRSININPPKHLILKQIKSQVDYSNWEVEEMFEFENIKGSKQLNIYGKHNIHRSFIDFFIFFTGLISEREMPGFDRYFVSSTSKKGWPSSVSLIGQKLKENRLLKTKDPLKYQGCVESLYVFEPKRQWDRIQSRFLRYKMALESAIGDRRLNKTKLRLKDKLFYKYSKSHLKKGYKFVSSDISIVLEPDSILEAVDLIENNYSWIARHFSKRAKKDLSRLYWRFIPIEFTRIFVYQENKRRIDLSGLSSNLICTITLNNSKKIQNIDILGGLRNDFGKYRIVWNKNWLEKD